MKKILLIILFAFTVNLLQAQVSGYIGKRFIIDYAFGTGFPHLHNEYSGEDRAVVPIFKHKLSLDITTSLKRSVGVTYKFAHANVINDFQSLDGTSSKFHYFQNHEIGPYVRVYLGNKIAPIGTYLQFGVNFETIFLNKLVTESTNNIQGYISGNYYQFDLNFRTTLGKNFILANNLKIGVELSSSLGAATQAISLLSWGEGIGNNTAKKSNPVGYFINAADNILELSVSVGLLGFK